MVDWKSLANVKQLAFEIHTAEASYLKHIVAVCLATSKRHILRFLFPLVGGSC